MDRLKVGTRSAIAGWLVTAASAIALGWGDYHASFHPFGTPVLWAEILGAITTLTGYIFVSSKLSPGGAMLFGGWSVVGAQVIAYLLGLASIFKSHAAILWAAAALEVLACAGIVAFLIGLVRYVLRFRRGTRRS